VSFSVLFLQTPNPTVSNFELTDNLNTILQHIDKVPFYVSVMTNKTTKLRNLSLPDNYELTTRLTFGHAVFFFYLQNATNKFRENIYQETIYKLGFSLKFRFHLFLKSRSTEMSSQTEAAVSLNNIL